MKPLPLSKLHYFFCRNHADFLSEGWVKEVFFFGPCNYIEYRIKFSSWFGRRVSLLLCSGDPRNRYPTNDEHLSCIVGDFGSPKLVNGESCGSSVTNSWWNLLIFHCHLQPEMFPTQEKAPKKAAGCQSELDPVPCPVGRPYQLIFHEVVPFPPHFPKPSYQKTTP